MNLVTLTMLAENFINGVQAPSETCPTMVQCKHAPSEAYRRYYAMTACEYDTFRSMVESLLS